MLKKLLTGCLTVAMVAALSATAMAEVNVKGKVRAYWGQMTPPSNDLTDANTGNTTTASSRFVNVGEANIQFSGTVGDITGFVEFETRGDEAEYNAAKMKATYQKDALTVQIGNDIFRPAMLGFLVVGKTSDLAKVGGGWADAPMGGYTEADHLGVSYKVADLTLALALFSNSPSVYDPANGNTVAGGTSATQISVDGMAGPVALRVSSTTKSSDNPNTAEDDSAEDLTSSYTHLGVMYPMGNMKFEFSYSTNTKKVDPASTGTYVADDNIWMRLAFNMTGAGPGALTVQYDTQTNTVDGEANYAVTWLGLGYDIPMGPGSGVDLMYLSSTTTPEGGDAISTSFIGGGFYAFF